MKNFLILFFAFNLSVFGSTLSQEVKGVSYNNATLMEVFEDLKGRAGCGILYKESEIDTDLKVSFQKENTSIQEVLDVVLLNSELTYRVQSDVIVIYKDNKPNIQQEDQKLISGTVKDTNGELMVGVNVYLSDGSRGTITDVNGHFELKVPADASSFKVSFIGFETKELHIGQQEVFDVIIKEEISDLSEVVVTGFQEIEKRKLSSSIATLSAEEMMQAAEISVDKMLEGKVAGMAVLSPTSMQGTAPKIRIRGASSISGNREPVWVVDGVVLSDPVPISPTELNSLDNINIIGNAISSLNPEDIERIDVLKDASATAIYGVKAANGVIVVTTRKGKKGAPKVTYSTNLSVSARPYYSQLDLMNSQERIEVSKEIEERGLRYATKPANIGYEGALQDFYSKKINYSEFAQRVKGLEEMNTDWLDLLFRTSFSQKHNVTISGADDKTNYYFSGGFTDAKGTFKDNNVTQYNVMMKFDTQLSERLKVGMQLRGAVSEKQYPHSRIDPFKYAYQTSRAIPAYDENGEYAYYNNSGAGENEIPLDFNILNELEHSDQTIKNQSLNFVGNLDYQIIEGVKFRSIISASKSNTAQTEWFDEETYMAAKLRHANFGEPFPAYDPDEEFYLLDCELPYGGQISNDNINHSSYSVRADLQFKRTLNMKHEFDAIGGTEFSSTQYEGINTTQMGYLPDRGQSFVDIDPLMFPQYAERQKTYKDVITDRVTNIVSLYGTFTYAFDNRYIANFNVRADGSNKFGQNKDNRFLPVWSVSGRWNAHNESFLKSANWLNQLSFRVSYGIQGNISDESNPNLLARLGARNDVSGYYLSTLERLPNPYLTWEKTTSYNIGLDFSVLNGRINGTVEAYKKIGEDMIVNRDLSITTGSNYMSMNGGDIENKGYDVSLTFIPVRTNNVMWAFNINGGKNINKVTDAGVTNLNYTDYLNGSAVLPGQALNSFYSYQYAGLDENGLPTFDGIEETDGITKEEMYAQMLTYSGKRTPDVEGGFSTDVRYKNWTLGAMFYFSLGREVRLNPLYEEYNQHLPNPKQNMDDAFVDRWRQPGDENHTDIPVLSDDPLSMGTGWLYDDRKIEIAESMWEMYNKSDLRVASGDFLRLRSLNLSYDFSKEICTKLHVNDLRLRFEASNLYTWKDKKLKGTDPQQVAFSSESASIPLTPVYTFGLNVTF
ncbi:SusC/RagA family TonB-linked outer membrane protein [Carboxylicivirga sp. RSCT41]|uniref:SusC/RagA family TonB-linked outer membrane protein n=1 Tax=Carboxylicivirga agarovorans TaxID=3417570 RepID=UPI003D33BD9D